MKTIGVDRGGVLSIQQDLTPPQDDAAPQSEGGVAVEKVQQAVDRLLVRMVPLSEIAFARRSKDVGLEHFNPRDEDDFHHWTMEDLESSIAQDGLFHFPNIRLVNKGGKSTYQLIAGERRIRAITNLVKRDAQVYDEATNELVPASVLYDTVPCRVVKHVDDMKALRMALQENGGKPLSEKSLIFLCEYLLSQEVPGEDRTYTRKEVAANLGKSESWLCQTLSFKTKLDPETYQQLLDEKITRSYAIDLMAYADEDRTAVHQAAHLVAEERFESALERAEAEQAEAEIGLTQAQELEATAPTPKKKATAHTKVERAKKKVETAAAKVHNIEEQGVQVQQSDLAAGAIEIGIQPLGVKGLSTKQLHDHWLDRLSGCLVQEKVRQPSTQRVYPRRDIMLLKYAAQAMANGEKEPLKVLDAFYKAQGGWGMFGTDGYKGTLEDARAAFDRVPVEDDEDLDLDDDEDLDLDGDLDDIDMEELGDLDDGPSSRFEYDKDYEEGEEGEDEEKD